MIESNLEEFQFEADALLKLQHPNIIRFWGVWTDAQFSQYMVLDFMECGSLDKYLTQRDFNSEELFQMSFGVALGMLSIAKRNFVHRDLAARNILVDKSLAIKVNDFGLSRELESTGFLKEEPRPIPVRWTGIFFPFSRL